MPQITRRAAVTLGGYPACPGTRPAGLADTAGHAAHPFAPGGASDIAARAFSTRLSNGAVNPCWWTTGQAPTGIWRHGC